MDHYVRLDRYPEGAPRSGRELTELCQRAGVSYTTATRWLSRLPVFKTKADRLEAATAAIAAERGAL
jgi:hypothetical protein